MSELERLTDGMLRSAIATKRMACRREGGPADLAPVADIIAALPNGTTGREIVQLRDRDELPAAVRLACAPLGARPLVIGLVSDAWGVEVPEGVKPRRGMAQEAFERLAPLAYEALMVVTLDVRSGALCCAEARYRQDDRGQPAFARAQRRETPDGAAVDALRASAAPWRGGGL